MELGAGTGFLATCACRTVGPEKVFVYEANPDLIETIRRTANVNGFDPQMTNAVLGDSAGTVDFYVHTDLLELEPRAGAGRPPCIGPLPVVPG